MTWKNVLPQYPSATLIGCVFDGVSREVGVASGGLDLGVAEQLGDHRQALAQCQCAGTHKSAAGRGCARRRGPRGRAPCARARTDWRAGRRPGAGGSPRGYRGGAAVRPEPCAASGESETVRGPVLLSVRWSSCASRRTSSQRSVWISLRRQPVSMSRRSAAAA